MKNPTRKRVPPFLIIIIIVVTLFIATRYSAHTTYIPFTGKIFDIQPERYTEIDLQNGKSGEMKVYTTDEERSAIADTLNALRYRFWLPKIPIQTGGWQYRVILKIGDRYVDYLFTERTITVNGICYFVPEEQLESLIAPVEYHPKT